MVQEEVDHFHLEQFYHFHQLGELIQEISQTYHRCFVQLLGFQQQSYRMEERL